MDINNIPPIDIYSRIQAMVQKEIDDKISKNATINQYDIKPVADHKHDGIGSTRIAFSDLEDKETNICFSLIDPITNTSVTSTIGGTWYMPLGGVITDVFATVDTAGTTNTTTIDIKKNGTSIFATTLTIDSGETTSLTAATKYRFNLGSSAILTSFIRGDYFTFDITQISTTPAKGLKVFLDIYKE